MNYQAFFLICEGSLFILIGFLLAFIRKKLIGFV